jgi:hypothetical protein
MKKQCERIKKIFTNQAKETQKETQKELLKDHKGLYRFYLDYFKDNKLPMDEITLIGIRDSNNIEKDVINDYLGYITKDKIFICKGTTESGVYYTTNKKDRNKQGTFHLKEGFHKAIWCVGTHKGYQALVNDWRYCLPTKGWRDVNYNFKYDEADIEVKGHFGINFHRMHPTILVPFIGRYSAGCQVVNSPKDFKHILDTVKSTQMYLGTSQKTVFNYLLLNIKDIPKGLI